MVESDELAEEWVMMDSGSRTVRGQSYFHHRYVIFTFPVAPVLGAR
jgi:hypothetical protein